MRVSLEFLAFGAVALCCGLGCSASGSPAAVASSVASRTARRCASIVSFQSLGTHPVYVT